MNIFASSKDPVESAKFLDNKRVIKMILESCQLLSTAINTCGGTGPYRSTHLNHPCSIWARTSKENYRWLLKHFEALLNEYEVRYNKTHKCKDYLEELKTKESYVKDGPLTEHPNCTIFKDVSNVNDAYKIYLNHKWKHDKRPPSWEHKTVLNRY